MRLLPLLLLAALVPAEDAAQPAKLDRFKLTNGRTLIGTVESETADAYNVRLAGGLSGMMVIKKDRVEIIERGAEDAPPPVAMVPVEDQKPAPRPVEAPEKVQEREAKAAAAEHIKQLRADAKKAGQVVSEAMVAEMKQGMAIKEVIAIIGDQFTTMPYGNANEHIYYIWKNKDGTGFRVSANAATGLIAKPPRKLVAGF